MKKNTIAYLSLISMTGFALSIHPVSAATSFVEDFSDNSEGPNMALGTGFVAPTTDFTGDFTITSGTGSRIYLGTNDTDYSTVDFVFEAEVTVPNGNPWAIAFLGMGNADAGGNPVFGEPLGIPHVMIALRNDGALAQSRDNAATANGATEITGLNSIVGNTHLMRLTWNSTTESALFEFDELNDGLLIASFPMPLDGSDNGFNASNSQLFLGGGNGLTFDNISVTVIPEPSASVLLGLGSVGLVLRRRRHK